MDLKIAGDIDAAESSEMLIATLKGFNAPASRPPRSWISSRGVEQVRDGCEAAWPGHVKACADRQNDGLVLRGDGGDSYSRHRSIRSGTESADALKTGLLKLVDDSKPVKEALASIGFPRRTQTES